MRGSWVRLPPGGPFIKDKIMTNYFNKSKVFSFEENIKRNNAIIEARLLVDGYSVIKENGRVVRIIKGFSIPEIRSLVHLAKEITCG
jgi:hypothetical protein